MQTHQISEYGLIPISDFCGLLQKTFVDRVIFYIAKASKSERGTGNTHPTVKPVKLMRYLVRLITPPGGTVLDPFAGSGTTLLAAEREGFDSIGIEMNPEYCEIIRKRMAHPEPVQACLL